MAVRFEIHSVRMQEFRFCNLCALKKRWTDKFPLRNILRFFGEFVKGKAARRKKAPRGCRTIPLIVTAVKNFADSL